MLKSKTRRRVAVKTAAIAAACGGIFFGAVPAIASMVATPKTVTYSCTGSGTTAAYKVQVDITGPLTPTPNSTVVATWAVQQPTASPFFTAASAIPATERLVIDGDALVTSSPSIVPSELRTAAATAAAASVPAGATLQPLPMLITMTPTGTGVIAVQPGSFSLYLEPASGTGSASGGDLYVCDVAATAEASAAALLITVKPSGTSTGTGTPTPTTTGTGTSTPTTTPTTPAPTVTVTTTTTAEPTKTRQIGKTPGGGASTGGGGDAGPDARMIMLSGALMVAGAAIGGLVLRRRTATRG
ncbi:hypothetical protein FHR32_003857 [Streptosporangium album]|uniref:Gram-positive cocci surface proteins LPxTG domain-containing protein n=1 Tax=Streptosporangium album TaxID=47479 RepID=A0A7W7W9M3_9ACTN|nr:hypothetical protein [Streptosporangium album]MBB4939552.1 hypothetical protein [Streptosporangium album]